MVIFRLQSKGAELHYPSLSYEEYDNTYDNLTNLLAMKKNYNSAVFSIVSESPICRTVWNNNRKNI